MLSADSFFELAGHRFGGLFEGTEQVWDALGRLERYIEETLKPNVRDVRRHGDLVPRTVALYGGEVIDEGLEVERGPEGRVRVTQQDGGILQGASVVEAGAVLAGPDIEIGCGALIESGAYVRGPAYIGDESEVRHGAYVRRDVLIGAQSVIGHSTHLERSVLLGGTVAEEFSYVGHSILGRADLGAGTKLANVRVVPGTVKVGLDGVKVDTGLEKMGAVIGDDVVMGCNCVTMPGTVLGRGVAVYPNVTVMGYHPQSTIIKVSVIQAGGRSSRGS